MNASLTPAIFLQEELGECLAPLRNMLVGIRYKTAFRVESEFTRC